MKEDTTILPFRQTEVIFDPLAEIAREGARRMLAEALKAEADAVVASFPVSNWRMAARGLCDEPVKRHSLPGSVLPANRERGFKPTGE